MAFLYQKFILIFLYFTGIICNETRRNPVIIGHPNSKLACELGVLKVNDSVDKLIQCLTGSHSKVIGDGGSQMQLKLDKPSTVHFWCDKKSDWFTNWVSVEELLPETIDCFADNMRMVFNATNGTYSNSPGVQSRMPYFGETTGIEYLDPSTKHVGEYFASFVQGLVDTGYVRGKSIRAAPYDFRNAPDLTGEYFARLKTLIEETFAINDNMPVVLVCHSLGCPYSSIFLHNQPQDWKDKYLRVWLTISAPWGGSVKTMGLYASGYIFGIPRILVNPLKLRAFQRSIKSSVYLLPSKDFWTPEHVFVKSATRNYTINDYDDFFKDIDYSIAIQMKAAVPPIFDPSPPNVPVLCLHGSGVNTPVTYKYEAGTFPDGPAHRVMGDGDGTVPINSLKGCARWKQDKPLIIKDFDSCEHNGILRDKSFIDFIKDFLYNKTF